jgi:uncharacterized protein (TIGR03083 family)
MTRPTTGKIDERGIAAAVTAERISLCDLLDTLTDNEWHTGSLCTEWTVHEVVAHLTLATRDTTWDLLKGAIKARGNFDRMTTDMAREHARRFAPPVLVQQLRDTATSTRRAPLSSRLDPLVDALVHAQDIARPLGRTYPTPPEHAVPALTHAVNSRWYGGSKRFRDVTMIATDANLSFGTGNDEARGKSGDLLLIATNRPAGLTQLSGPGVEVLAARLE